MRKDVAFGQYYPVDSFVHRTDPRTKLLFLIAYIVALFCCKTGWGMALCALGLLTVILLAKLPLKLVVRSVRGVVFLLVFTGILNLFFYRGEGEALISWKFIHIYKEGIFYTIYLMSRLFLLVMSSAVLTLTTTPIALTDGLESLLTPLKYIRFPVHELALIMSIALRFIPTLMDETERIINAQKARGADFESGNVFKRIKAIIPILIPLLISAFRRAEELGDAMDARCYSGSSIRTKYKKLRFTYRDVCAFFFMAILMTGVFLFNSYGAALSALCVQGWNALLGLFGAV